MIDYQNKWQDDSVPKVRGPVCLVEGVVPEQQGAHLALVVLPVHREVVPVQLLYLVLWSNESSYSSKSSKQVD